LSWYVKTVVLFSQDCTYREWLMGHEAFSSQLRRLREMAGITQQELAKRAGLTTDAISRLERGDRQPSWETVLALGKALGVPCTAFDAEDQADSLPVARPRGRPRKVAAGEAAGELPPPQEKPHRRKGPRTRGN
jgi:transcriptional regulator with XRE-family HTH domain